MWHSIGGGQTVRAMVVVMSIAIYVTHFSPLHVQVVMCCRHRRKSMLLHWEIDFAVRYETIRANINTSVWCNPEVHKNYMDILRGYLHYCTTFMLGRNAWRGFSAYECIFLGWLDGCICLGTNRLYVTQSACVIRKTCKELEPHSTEAILKF